jgi:hypothetical protein
VEQADLPVREAVSDLQYYDITKGRRDGFFTGHTGIKWSYDTIVAYKGLSARGRRKRASLFSDLLKELRILCHPPLQRHPNIAYFMGLAWVREEDISSETVLKDTETKGSREWPILITEKAELGTLRDFVQYKAHCRKRISLLAKARFLSDILEAILVGHFLSSFVDERPKFFNKTYTLVESSMAISRASTYWYMQTLLAPQKTGRPK